jgi:hypothetical protein
MLLVLPHHTIRVAKRDIFAKLGYDGQVLCTVANAKPTPRDLNASYNAWRS